MAIRKQEEHWVTYQNESFVTRILKGATGRFTVEEKDTRDEFVFERSEINALIEILEAVRDEYQK